MAENLSPSLLDCLFRFAALNEGSSVALGTAAMSCVNEMLARNCVPRELEEFLVQVFRCVQRTSAGGEGGFWRRLMRRRVRCRRPPPPSLGNVLP